jgi:hypothetical protein
VRDSDQPVGRLETTVESMHLVAEAVQALQDGVELTIVEVVTVHCG